MAKWKLMMGTHRGTVESRTCYKAPREFDTLDECKKHVADEEGYYKAMGYVVWFAEATAPDGTKYKLRG